MSITSSNVVAESTLSDSDVVIFGESYISDVNL